MQSNKFDSSDSQNANSPLNRSSSEHERAQSLPSSVEDITYTDGNSMSVTDFVEVIFRRKWWMLLIFLLIMLLGMFYTMSRTRIYSSTAEIMVNQSSQGMTSTMPLFNDLAGLTKSRSITTQVHVMNSPDLLRQAYDSLPVDVRLKLGSFSMVKNSSLISTMKDSDIIAVTVKAPNPAAAATMANTIVSTYQDRDLKMSRQATNTAALFIKDELSSASNDLSVARRALADYKKKTGFYALDVTLSQKVQFVGRLEEELLSGNRQLQEDQESTQRLAASLSETEKVIISREGYSANPIRAKIESQLDTLEATRIELLQTEVQTSPEVLSLDAQITAARKRLAENLEMRITDKVSSPNPALQDLQKQYISTIVNIDGTRSRLAALQNQLTTKKNELTKLPDQELHVTELMSDVNQMSAMVSLLTDQYQTLRISDKARMTNVQVVTKAHADPTPIAPKVSVNLFLSLILGIVFAFGLAALLEMFDDRIHSSEELERLYPLPVLAQIPFIHEGSVNLINSVDSHSPLLEGFRLLRGNLLFSGLRKAQHLIGVSSSGAGEGKSTTAINLAVSLAMDGKKVIIVDCDLRKPSLHNYFQISREIGFTDLLTGTCQIAQVIKPTTVERLSFLASGTLPLNPPEVLNSQVARELFEDLEQLYDVVIVDMPPTTGFSDVPILSTLLDTLLLVVSAKDTHRGQFKAAIRALEQVDAPLLGFVFNKFSYLNNNNSYYYYYYGESGTQSKSQNKHRHHRKKSKANLNVNDSSDDKQQ